MTIAVTGVTGHLGRVVAEGLVTAGRSVRLVARDTARAPHLPGSHVVAGDFEDPASLREAFSGAASAFVVSVPAPPDARSRLHVNAFEAAVRAGVEHVVYLSLQASSGASGGVLGRAAHESEEALAAVGVRHTILRSNVHVDALPGWFGRDGVVRGPAGEGAAAFVARDDVARVVIASLTDEATPDRRVVDVTGPEALTLAEVAERLAAVTGLDLAYEEESLDRARAKRRELGAPQWETDAWLDTLRAISAGAFAATSDVVERMTGRTPIGLEAFVQAHPQSLAHLRPESAG